MNRLKSVMLLSLLSVAVGPAPRVRGGEDMAEVLRQMPADYPLVFVVRDLAKFEKSLQGWAKRLSPDAPPPQVIGEIKSAIGSAVGDWIDFSSPVGVAVPSLGSKNDKLIWARVANFAEKVKTVEGAVEKDGVWELPFAGKETLYAKVNGDYATIANLEELLPTFAPDAKTLHAEMTSRLDLLTDRDILIHVNFEPLRPHMLGGLAQASQAIGPIMMMAMAQQGGDSSAMTAMVTGFLDGAKRFAEQVSYLEIAVGLEAEAAKVTLATGFGDGPIKSYLTNQKPANRPLLAHLEEQPFFAALGYHFPGEESPVIDYLYGKALAALAKPDAQPGANAGAGAGPGGEDAAGAMTKTLKESLENQHKLYRAVEGMNTLYAFGQDGMRGIGDFIMKDPGAGAALLKKSMTQAHSAMMQIGGGLDFESQGEKTIGDAAVEEYKVKVDTTNPAGAMMMTLYGADARMAIGTVQDRVRFVMGNEEFVKRSFGKADKVLTEATTAKEALAALPAKHNLVALIDPAGLLPMIGPMIGMGKVETVPMGAPIGFSMSLSGDPARIDLHIPIRAIERVIQAAAADAPM